MGAGVFANGKFELHVSLRYSASSEEIEYWKHSFTRASAMLYNATDGGMQFGTIYISNDSAGSDEADAWLLPEGDGRTFLDVGPGHINIPEAFGEPEVHMILANGEKNAPFNVLHEFGHYGLGLGDEYLGAQPGTERIVDVRCATAGNPLGRNACIMGVPLKVIGSAPPTDPAKPPKLLVSGDIIDKAGEVVKGLITEFCTDDNHDVDAPSFHNNLHPLPGGGGGKSCASVIQELHGIQVATGLKGADVPGHQPIEWIEVSATPQFALALDSSMSTDDGSLEAGGGIDGLIESANYWLQSADEVGDGVAVVPFGTEPSGGLEATDGAPAQPSIGRAIDAARAEIKRPEGRAATQAMVLFSTGNDRTPAPGGLVDALVRDGIRVFTVGLGSDRARLQEVAERTKGEFYEISPRGGSDAIRDHVMSLADQLRAGPPILEVSSRTLAAGSDQSVRVEKGSKRLKFVLRHTSGMDLGLSATGPERGLVSADDESVTATNSPSRGYETLSIEEPEAGDWVVRVDPPPEDGGFRFTLSAYSENPGVHIGVSGARRLYQLGDTVTLHVVVSSPIPVVGLTVAVARITSPTGKEQTVVLEPQRQGVYVGSFEADEVGPFEVELEVRNDGNAVPAGLRVPEDDSWKEELEIPEFQRVKRFQVHVGEPSDSH